MKKFVCPDCGKEYSEDNIPMECTTCGCPSDMIKINEISDVTPKMNFCPQCGSLLPSQQVRFCPNCGCELSSQKLRDVDTICPDCNSVITDVNKDCPICGCPSNMFIQRAKTKFIRGETLECPDCGKIFVETIPADCPNCGCPSDKFTKHKNENAPQKSSSPKSTYTVVLIIIVGIIGFITYLVYNRAQQVAEQARQEQYAKEQQERREREIEERRRKEEETRRIEQENERFLNQIAGTYTSQYKYYRGEYIRYRISLYKSKRYTVEILGYNYRVLSSQSGNFSPVAQESGCVLNPNTSNSSWIDVVGSHLEWGDIDLY